MILFSLVWCFVILGCIRLTADSSCKQHRLLITALPNFSLPWHVDLYRRPLSEAEMLTVLLSSGSCHSSDVMHWLLSLRLGAIWIQFRTELAPYCDIDIVTIICDPEGTIDSYVIMVAVSWTVTLFIICCTNTSTKQR